MLQTMRFVVLAVASAYQSVRTCPAVGRLRAARRTPAMAAAAPTVSTLWRYPIKGFPPDSLASVSLQENGTFPQDRLWALADAADDGGFDASNPQWVHKQHFFGAFRSRDRLASLNTSFYGSTTVSDGRLTFHGAPEITVDPSTREGRETIESIIQRRVGAATKLVTGGEAHQFGNTRSGVRHHGDTRTVHVVNAASVAAVRRATGLDVDAAVFRPNIVLDGLEAWVEEDWVGKTVELGGVLLEVIARTVRCDAINFHPITGERWPNNRDLVQEIADNFPAVGPYLGVYARVAQGGTLGRGGAVAVM
jgi:uncharacterized protein YcbX